MNVPNAITILRILSIPAFTICLLYNHHLSALIIFVGAGISDALDGLIAKAWNQRTTLGAHLDPIADKLLLATAFVALALMRIIPYWLTVLVIARDIIILLGFVILILTSHTVDVKPTLTSKVNTVFQIMTVTGALLTPYHPSMSTLLYYLIWSTAILTCMSGLHYLYIGSRVIENKGG